MTRHWRIWLLGGGLGMVGAASAAIAAWHASASGHIVTSPASHVSVTDGVITGLDLMKSTQRIRVATAEGQERTLEVDFNTTSVFESGAVLNLAHLKMGERVRVLSTTGGREAIATSIEVVHRPSSTQIGAVPARTQVNYIFGDFQDESQRRARPAASTSLPWMR